MRDGNNVTPTAYEYTIVVLANQNLQHNIHALRWPAAVFFYMYSYVYYHWLW